MKTFLPKTRSRPNGRPPWGYKVDEVDRLLLVPIVAQLTALEKAKDYLDKGASFQKTAAWLQSESGCEITQTTLKRLYEDDKSREEGHKERAKLIVNYTTNNVNRKHSKNRTPEQKLVVEIGRKKAAITQKQKHLQRLREAQPDAVQSVETPKAEAAYVAPAQPVPDVRQYITPNPGPQTDFLAASEFSVLFGGAAGGGKSHAIIIDPLRTAHMKSHRAITFRRTNDELRELIWMSKEIYPNVFPGAKFSDQKSTWYFPNGGTHWFRYLDRDEDVLSLQGQAFTHAYWDELTQWPTPFPVNYVRSRLRTTDPEMEPFVCERATSNPGNAGHGWVKRTFIDPAPFNVPFPAVDIESGEVLKYPPGHKKAGEILFHRRFIPSKLSDNKYLADSGAYERTLLSLPEVQRKQLLEGNWDVAEGAAFSEFFRPVHVCEPFQIPNNWSRFRACDWGYQSRACVLWMAEDFDKKLWVYREWYPTKVEPGDFARRVAELEAGDRVNYGILDSSCWGGRQDGGPPIVQMMDQAVRLGWRPADRSKGSREHRKMEVHSRLKIVGDPPNLRCGLTIFNNCVNLIRTLPVIPLDKNNSEDVDTKSEDHAYDALAYGCASRPYGRYRKLPRGSASMFRPNLDASDVTFGY